MMSINDHKLINWLGEYHNDNEYTNNKYGNYYMGKRDYEDYDKYYMVNDIDMKMNDEGLIAIMNTMSLEDIMKDQELVDIYNSMEKYVSNGKSKYVLIPRNTNRAHVNYLYKRLIDLATYNNIQVFDKTMKESFYNFCYENSQMQSTKSLDSKAKVIAKLKSKNKNDVYAYNFDKYIDFLWERVFTVYLLDTYNNSILSNLKEHDKSAFYKYILYSNKNLVI